MKVLHKLLIQFHFASPFNDRNFCYWLSWPFFCLFPTFILLINFLLSHFRSFLFQQQISFSFSFFHFSLPLFLSLTNEPVWFHFVVNIVWLLMNQQLLFLSTFSLILSCFLLLSSSLLSIGTITCGFYSVSFPVLMRTILMIHFFFSSTHSCSHFLSLFSRFDSFHFKSVTSDNN